MNNGDSFHNGSDNLELQRKNRLGISDDSVKADDPPAETAAPTNTPASESSQPYTNLYAQKPVEPHQRPYQNIYAQNVGVSRSAVPSDAPADAQSHAEPAERNYTNVYAKRVAERTEPTEASQFGNGFQDGQPYYGTPTDTPAFSDPSAENEGSSGKKNLNLAALILAIISIAGNLCCLTCITPITAILSIVFAFVGRENGRFGQKGLIGLILSIVYLVLFVLIALFYVLVIVLEASGPVI